MKIKHDHKIASKFISLECFTTPEVGRKPIRNQLISASDFIQDIWWEKDSTKRHHQRHHQRQLFVPISIFTGCLKKKRGPFLKVV